jgi:type 1 glutamine amidotransferase
MRLSARLLLALGFVGVSLSALGGVSADASQPAPLRIFLRGGPKTHGPAGDGHHDGPSFVKDWKPLLESRGAVVDAALTFPTPDQLAATDVLVMFCANGGDIDPAARPSFDAFLRRGGGIVALHDAVLSRDPQWFKTIIGGAWENGVARYFEGENTYYYVNPSHPITRGAANFTLTDEVYWNLHLMPDIQVLAVAPQPRRQTASSPAGPDTIGSLIPQLWVYEHQLPGGQPYRAVVSLLGHHFSTFSWPHVRAICLRAIAWAARRDADSLATAEELSALH